MSEPVDVPEITPTELSARLETDDVPVLLDVREHFERRIADNGQHRIPVGELLARMDEVDPSAEIVVYCRSGSRSAWAAKILLSKGYENVLNLQGGVLAWRQDVDPSLRAY